MSVNLTTPLATLDASAVVTHFSTQLRRKAIARDIYTNIRGDDIVYKNDQAISIPDAIYTKIEAATMKGCTNLRVAMKMPVNANILRGRTVALGTEVAPVIKTGSLYRNNYRFVVEDEPGYGEDKLDAQPYSLYQEHVNDLSPHAAAEEGLEIRQCLVESNAWNLWVTSTAATCPAQWNRNCYVVGLPVTQQPIFHPNYATYTNRIVSAIDSVSGNNGRFAQSGAQMVTCGELDKMIRWAFRRIMPFTMEGRSAFVLTVSQLGAERFTNPSVQDSLANRWVQVDRIQNEKVQNWYGIIGKYVGANATIYVVIDDRLATVLPSGSGAPYGLAPGYVWPTDNDLRNLDNPLVRDACILHGRAAIFKWEPEPLHLIQQDWDYDIRNGKGYAGVRGIMQLQFDTTPADPTGAAREYWGSALVIAGRYDG